MSRLWLVLVPFKPVAKFQRGTMVGWSKGEEDGICLREKRKGCRARQQPFFAEEDSRSTTPGFRPSTLSLKPRNALAHPSPPPPPSRHHRHPGFNAVKFSSPTRCKISILNNSTSVRGVSVHKYNACQGDNLALGRLIASQLLLFRRETGR